MAALSRCKIPHIDNTLAESTQKNRKVFHVVFQFCVTKCSKGGGRCVLCTGNVQRVFSCPHTHPYLAASAHKSHRLCLSAWVLSFRRGSVCAMH